MEAEERQALSIDSQLKEMHRIAERDKLRIAAVKVEAHSAKDSGRREVFNQIIDEIREGRYNALLTWAPDRLSRNAGDLGKLVDLMDSQLLVEIRTFNQKFTNSPNEKFLLMILCSQAKLENDNRSINVKRGLRTRVELGLWPTSAPTGYMNSRFKDQKGHVELDPERAPIIRKMFEKIANEGWSTREAYRWLRSTNYRTPHGKQIALSNVQTIFRNPFYYGRFEYPKGSGNWYKGIHTPLISKQLFDQVQRRFIAYKHKRRSHIREFPFVRLMRCGLCGSGITADEKIKPLKNGDVAKYVYYGCTRSRDTFCKCQYVREEELMVQLADIIDTLDVDLIGMRERLEWEIERWYKVHGFLIGTPSPDRTRERRDTDLRQYAKLMLVEGTIPERRELLRFLKSRLLLKDRKIFLDTAPEKDVKTHDADGKPRKQTLTSSILFQTGEMIFFLHYRDHTVGITNGQLVTTATDQEGKETFTERTTLHGNFNPVSDLLDLLQKPVEERIVTLICNVEGGSKKAIRLKILDYSSSGLEVVEID
jgi:DNA invertase Pin-like site-specific DNA recombinase